MKGEGNGGENGEKGGLGADWKVELAAVETGAEAV